jgi:hypothetical protein
MRLSTEGKIPEAEYTKTNSIYSSMRLVFIKVVKFWIVLSTIIVISIVGCAIASVFTPKPIELPVTALLGVIGTIGVVAFGGKAAQSFSEPDALEIDTMKVDGTKKEGSS